MCDPLLNNLRALMYSATDWEVYDIMDIAR